MNHEYLTAINASIEAGKAILEIYNSSSNIEVVTKSDNSPLTLADQASNTIINQYLANSKFPMISEENKEVPYHERKEWESCWIIDPLDGTKEFIKKNGEFTVNIALCTNGTPLFGVIYVPVSGELYYASVEEGQAYKTMVNAEHKLDGKLFLEMDQIAPAKAEDGTIRIVGSRSHLNDDTKKFIESIQQENNKIDIVSKGSSLKFCLVAEGKADIYPRFAPTMEWDTAAGHAICNAVGLEVIDQETAIGLRYNKENLLNPYFMIKNS